MRRQSNTPEPETLIRTRAAATLLGVHPDTLLKYARNGEIEPVKLAPHDYRWRPSAIQKLIEKKTQSAA